MCSLLFCDCVCCCVHCCVHCCFFSVVFAAGFYHCVHGCCVCYCVHCCLPNVFVTVFAAVFTVVLAAVFTAMFSSVFPAVCCSVHDIVLQVLLSSQALQHGLGMDRPDPFAEVILQISVIKEHGAAILLYDLVVVSIQQGIYSNVHCCVNSSVDQFQGDLLVIVILSQWAQVVKRDEKCVLPL